MDEQNKSNSDEQHNGDNESLDTNEETDKLEGIKQQSHETTPYEQSDYNDQMRKAYHMQLTQGEEPSQEQADQQQKWAEQQREWEQQLQVQKEKKEQQQRTAEKTNTQQKVSYKKRNSNKGKLKGFLQMIAAAVIGSVLTLGTVTQLDYFQPGSKVPENINNQQMDSDTTTAKPISTSNSVADIVENSSEAIVGIVNMGEQQQQNPFLEDNADGEIKRGVGSGVIYKVTKDAAFIVTNNHVIADASSLRVSLENGDTVDGELVGTDPLTDIAVVKIKGEFDISPLKFGDSDTLRSGDQVIAIGNPLGLDLSRTVTQGIISATDRTIPVQTSMGEWEFEVIQTDAAINPGNSGGALINGQGELVGINSLKIANNGVEGLGFSIPSNEVRQLVDEISENGKIVRPYVGVGLKSVSEIPPYYLQDLPDNVKDGAVVLTVDENSEAAKAGMKVEDVIVAINGENVTSDKDFRSYLYKKLSIGDEVTLDVYRDGNLEKVKLTLTSNADVE